MGEPDKTTIVAPDPGCDDCGSPACCGWCVFDRPTQAWADVGGVE